MTAPCARSCSFSNTPTVRAPLELLPARPVAPEELAVDRWASLRLKYYLTTMSSKKPNNHRGPVPPAKTLRVHETVDKINAHLDGRSALALDYLRAWFAAQDGRMPAPAALIRVALVRMAQDLDRLSSGHADTAPVVRAIVAAAQGSRDGEVILAAGRDRLASGVESWAECLDGREAIAQRLQDLEALARAMQRHESAGAFGRSSARLQGARP